ICMKRAKAVACADERLIKALLAEARGVGAQKQCESADVPHRTRADFSSGISRARAVTNPLRKTLDQPARRSRAGKRAPHRRAPAPRASLASVPAPTTDR